MVMRILFTLIVLSILIALVGFFSTLINSVYSQNITEEKKSENNIVVLDWKQIAEIVGLSTILGGLLSAYLTHRFSIKELKEEHVLSIQKLEKEIRINKTEDRKKIYDQIKFHLDRMTQNPDYKSATEAFDKLWDTVDDIDAILMPNYHLISDKIRKEWWQVRYGLRDAFIPGKSSVKFEEFKKKVSKMDNSLQLETPMI
jgi:Na+-transporting methylmalonyl-CoA/oxaloacetate decarboxylase gamma subunit